MGTVFRAFGMRFMIFPNDHSPPHLHVYGQGGQAKFNLIEGGAPQLVSATGLTTVQLRQAQAAIQLRQDTALRAWRSLHG